LGEPTARYQISAEITFSPSEKPRLWYSAWKEVSTGYRKGRYPHYLDEGNYGIVYPHPHWQEESAPWTQLAEHPELLILADPPVIPLGRFLEILLVLGQLLRIGKRHAVDPLEGIVFCVAKEV